MENIEWFKNINWIYSIIMLCTYKNCVNKWIHKWLQDCSQFLCRVITGWRIIERRAIQINIKIEPRKFVSNGWWVQLLLNTELKKSQPVLLGKIQDLCNIYSKVSMGQGFSYMIVVMKHILLTLWNFVNKYLQQRLLKWAVSWIDLAFQLDHESHSPPRDIKMLQEFTICLQLNKGSTKWNTKAGHWAKTNCQFNSSLGQIILTFHAFRLGN